MEETKLPSLDFISGLIIGEGAFIWVKQGKLEQPVFQLKMQAIERPLFEMIKIKMGLTEKIYEYTHQGRHYVLLMIRRRSTIENTIIPIFDGRLFGSKKIQFENWKNKYFENKLNFLYKHYQ